MLTAVQTCITIILLQDGPLGVDTDGALQLLPLLQTCCFSLCNWYRQGVGLRCAIPEGFQQRQVFYFANTADISSCVLLYLHSCFHHFLFVRVSGIYMAAHKQFCNCVHRYPQIIYTGIISSRGALKGNHLLFSKPN